MSMPADVVMVPVIGTWLDGTGAACSTASRVVLSPVIRGRLADTATNVVVMPQRFQVSLDATGSISTSVIATDCAALAGIVGMTWHAAVILYSSAGVQLAPYTVVFPAPVSTVGSINLSSPMYATVGQFAGEPQA